MLCMAEAFLNLQSVVLKFLEPLKSHEISQKSSGWSWKTSDLETLELFLTWRQSDEREKLPSPRFLFFFLTQKFWFCAFQKHNPWLSKICNQTIPPISRLRIFSCVPFFNLDVSISLSFSVEFIFQYFFQQASACTQLSSFYVFENAFLPPSLLSASLAEHRLLGWQLYLLSFFKVLFHCLLATAVADEKFAIRLAIIPLQVICLFSGELLRVCLCSGGSKVALQHV